MTGPCGLAVDERGIPRKPLYLLDLDAIGDLRPQSLEGLARAAVRSPQIVVGLARRPPSPRLDRLLGALDLTHGEGEVAGREVVPVADLERSLADLEAAVAEQPQAAVALAALLRQTAQLDPFAGFAAEAATYSMLLGGAGFARWLGSRDDRQRAAPGAVLIEEREGEVDIVLDRPDSHNALDTPMRDALHDALLALCLRSEAGSAIHLRGSGPSFCSGGDLAEFGTATDFVASFLVRLERAPWRPLEHLASRAHAHVHGATIGAGLELAAFAARLTAAPGTVFQLPEVSMGLVPGAGGTVSVTRRIGRWRAAWLMVSGTRIDAAKALDWGLADALG